jgi:hypothetical protein
MVGVSVEAKTTPEVPMVAETEPGLRMPMPTAPAPWSPAPAATGVPATRPVADAPDDEMRAQISGPSKRGGSQDMGTAMGDVEEQGAGGLLHVDGVFAGELEADVVFRAKDVGDSGEDFGLVLLDPEELGEGEVGQGGI